jgi:DNA-directed RNA polymerase specialized sigma24 family protein
MVVEGVAVLGLSYAKAGKRAGLSAKAVEKIMGDERVQRYIERLRRQTEKKHQVTRDDVIAGLLEARERAEMLSEPSTEIRAWEVIAKLQGLNAPERVVHELPEETKRMIDTLRGMKDEEVAKIAGVDGMIELGPEDYQEVDSDAG